MLHALREIEAGNERLSRLITRLIEEGAEFEGLMSAAAQSMTALGGGAGALPDVARRLDAAGPAASKTSLAAGDQAVLDDLFARYTMERERDVHRDFLHGFGIVLKMPVKAPASVSAEEDDGVLLF